MKGDIKGDFNVEKICDRIIFVATQRGMSIAELFRQCNECRATFYNWQSQRTVPKLDVICKIAKILNVTVEYIVYGENSGDKQNEKVFYSGYCKALLEVKDFIYKKGVE